mmetsp:Transcript_50717/g.127235  ORF Transcript_50717/g.127235 Transcript_50717/m.127235 type:complete len:225 (-) Transcript_50717:118-792(-)
MANFQPLACFWYPGQSPSLSLEKVLVSSGSLDLMSSSIRLSTRDILAIERLTPPIRRCVRFLRRRSNRCAFRVASSTNRGACLSIHFSSSVVTISSSSSWAPLLLLLAVLVALLVAGWGARASCWSFCLLLAAEVGLSSLLLLDALPKSSLSGAAGGSASLTDVLFCGMYGSWPVSWVTFHSPWCHLAVASRVSELVHAIKRRHHGQAAKEAETVGAIAPRQCL